MLKVHKCFEYRAPCCVQSWHFAATTMKVVQGHKAITLKCDCVLRKAWGLRKLLMTSHSLSDFLLALIVSSLFTLNVLLWVFMGIASLKHFDNHDPGGKNNMI